MRLLTIGIVALVLVSTIAYAAGMTGTVTALGGGADTVPHCQVLDYEIAASDTISSVNANVKCDVSGSYTVTASVNSGSGTGSAGVSLTAGIPQIVAISISPSVSISSSAYAIDLAVTR